jgi:hypothetical protein
MFPQIHKDTWIGSGFLEHLQNAIIDGADVNAIVHNGRNILENIIYKRHGSPNIFRFLISCNAKVCGSRRIHPSLIWNRDAYIFAECGSVKSTDKVNGYPILFEAALSNIELFQQLMYMGGDQFMIYDGLSLVWNLHRNEFGARETISWASLIIAGLIIPPKIIRTLYDDEQIFALYSLNL